MNEPDIDINIIEHRSAGYDLRRMPHPDEGHGRPEVELYALLDEVKRTEREVVATRDDENNSPDAA
jgi:hypothetical protein